MAIEMNEDHYRALALFATAFSVETAGALTRAKVLSATGANEIFDRCLSNFDTETAKASDAEKVPLALARRICERALGQLLAQNSRHQERN